MLQVYDEIRRPRAQSVWEGSRRQADYYECYGPHGPTPDGIRQDIEGTWGFVWDYPLNADMDKAVARLQDMGVYRRQLPHCRL